MLFSLPPVRLELACPDVPLRDELVSGLAFKGAVPLEGAPSLVPGSPGAPGRAPAMADVRIAFELCGAHEDVAEIARERLEGTDPTSPPRRHPGGLTVHAAGGCYVIVGEDAMAIVEPERGRATVRLGAAFGGALAEAQREVVFYLLALPLMYLVAHQGYYPLHAAALVRDGRCVVMTAPSGAGKTTATLLLIEHGWSYLSDDTILLHRVSSPGAARGEDVVQATSYRRAFSLSDDALQRFPALAARAWPRSPGVRNKRRVEPEDVYPGAFQRSARPSVLIFPELTTSASPSASSSVASRLEPIAPWSACGLLIGQSALVVNENKVLQQDYLAVLGLVTRQCTAYRLMAGPDLLADHGRLDTLLRAILR